MELGVGSWELGDWSWESGVGGMGLRDWGWENGVGRLGLIFDDEVGVFRFLLNS